MILLQKQWRGYLGRKRYKKMKAALTIMEHYRHYKLYVYVSELAKTFKNAKSMSDYGKDLPWPRETFAVRKSVPLLRKIFAKWRAWMILRNIPREEWPQLRIKVRTLVSNSQIRFFFLSINNLNSSIRCQREQCYAKNALIGDKIEPGKATTCHNFEKTPTGIFLTLQLTI